jgi:rod shape-determining protein MreD
VAAPRTSREQFEVYRFHWITAVAVPLVALLLQAYLPLRLPFFDLFDLPLLVTIYFGVARRNQLTGMATGCIIGLIQDSLTHRPLGLYGIAKTIIGFAASSVGLRIDVDNPGSRLLMGVGFYVVHQLIYFAVARGLAIQSLTWRWGHEGIAAIANALLAVVLFTVLDKLRQRA